MSWYGIRKRVLWTLKQNVSWLTERNAFVLYNGIKETVLFSIPTYCYLADVNMDDIYYGNLLIKLKDPTDLVTSGEIQDDLVRALTVDWWGFTAYFIRDKYKDLEKARELQSLLDMIFNGTIAVMMFLCFFSLSASMSANLYEQQKEIGIMRAIGVTKWMISRIYFYEAFILVVAASFSGMFTGIVIGLTMMAQSEVFTNNTLTFEFPWLQFFLIMGLSLLFAFFATYGPATQVTRKQISAIFRSN